MKKADFISGLVLMSLSLWLLLYAIPVHTGKGIGYGLSPSGLPNLMASGLLVLSVIQVVSSAVSTFRSRKNADAEQNTIDGDEINYLSHGRFLATILLVFVLTLLTMNYLGFLSGAILFMIFFQYLVGQRNYLLMGILAVAVPLLIQFIFWHGMSILLPEGVLF